MAGNGTEPRDKRNLETTRAHATREARVGDLGALHLLATRGAAVLEGIEVANFTQKGARADDGEAGPQTPDEAAENGDDFVAK